MGSNKVTVAYDEALEMLNWKIAPTIGGTGSDSEPNIQESIISILIMFHNCQEAFHGKSGGDIAEVYERMASYIGTQGYDNRGFASYSGILANTRWLVSLINDIYKNIKYKENRDTSDSTYDSSEVNKIPDIIELNPELFNKAISEYGGVKQAENFELNTADLIPCFQQQDKNILALVECFNKVTQYFESHLSQTDTDAGYLDQTDRCLKSMASQIEGIYNAYIDSLTILQSTVETLSESNDSFKTLLEDLNNSLARVELGTGDDAYSDLSARADGKIGTLSGDMLAALGPGSDGTYRANQEILASQGEETGGNSVTMGGVTYNDSLLSQLTDAEQKDLANYALSPEKAALVLSGDELQNYKNMYLQNAGSVFNENGTVVYGGTMCNTQEDRAKMLEQYKRNNPNATEEQIRLYDTFLSTVINAKENPNDETYRNILMKYTDENGNLNLSGLGLATNYTEVVRNRDDNQIKSSFGDNISVPSSVRNTIAQNSTNYPIGSMAPVSTLEDPSRFTTYQIDPKYYQGRARSETAAAQYTFNYDLVNGNISPIDAKPYLDEATYSKYETYYNNVMPIHEMQSIVDNSGWVTRDNPKVQALNQKYGMDVYDFYLRQTGAQTGARGIVGAQMPMGYKGETEGQKRCSQQ
jgi:hypothetical protein